MADNRITRGELQYHEIDWRITLLSIPEIYSYHKLYFGEVSLPADSNLRLDWPVTKERESTIWTFWHWNYYRSVLYIFCGISSSTWPAPFMDEPLPERVAEQTLLFANSTKRGQPDSQAPRTLREVFGLRGLRPLAHLPILTPGKEMFNQTEIVSLLRQYIPITDNWVRGRVANGWIKPTQKKSEWASPRFYNANWYSREDIYHWWLKEEVYRLLRWNSPGVGIAPWGLTRLRKMIAGKSDLFEDVRIFQHVLKARRKEEYEAFVKPTVGRVYFTHEELAGIESNFKEVMNKWEIAKAKPKRRSRSSE